MIYPCFTREASRPFTLHALVFVTLWFSLCAPCGADWPRFRGPDGNGVTEEEGLPVEWSATKNIAWKLALPGRGASSPVVYQGKVYVACFSGYGMSDENPGEMKDLKLHVVSVDAASGKLLWDESLPARLPEEAYGQFVKLHGYASGTPAVDDTGVYAFFGKTGAASWTHDGKLRWHKPLGDGVHVFGSGSSPVLTKNAVIVNAFVESGKLYALDKQNGEPLWEVDGLDDVWNTPNLVPTEKRLEAVFTEKNRIRAVDATTGLPAWTCEAIPDYICPSVIWNDGVVYAIGGRQGMIAAVKAGGEGDVTSKRLWLTKKGSNVSSPVFVNDVLYWAHEKNGLIYAANAKTGEILNEQKIDPRPGLIYASPLAGDGKLYFVSRESGTYVYEANPELKPVAHNVIEDDKSAFNGSIAVDNSRFYMRSDKFLYCIAKP